jgi:hypothetical protein
MERKKYTCIMHPRRSRRLVRRLRVLHCRSRILVQVCGRGRNWRWKKLSNSRIGQANRRRHLGVRKLRLHTQLIEKQQTVSDLPPAQGDEMSGQGHHRRGQHGARDHESAYLRPVRQRALHVHAKEKQAEICVARPKAAKHQATVEKRGMTLYVL